MAFLSRVRLSARLEEGEGEALLKRELGVSDLRGGGVGGVREGEGAALRGESVLFVDSMVMNVGEGERSRNNGEGALGSRVVTLLICCFRLLRVVFVSSLTTFCVSHFVEPMEIFEILCMAPLETKFSEVASHSCFLIEPSKYISLA